MFTCIDCEKKCKETQRVYYAVDYCRTCHRIESARNIKEDSVYKAKPGEDVMSNPRLALRNKPPKYIIDPVDWPLYGYISRAEEERMKKKNKKEKLNVEEVYDINNVEHSSAKHETRFGVLPPWGGAGKNSP